jgi:putative protease
MINNPLELLAPAGHWDSLSAAIRAGADSVYFGLKELNMRARASRSFEISDLKKLVRLCHSTGVKCYLALNVVIYDENIELMKKMVDAARDHGVDAIIATDWAVLRYAQENSVPVHISTQANITNIEALKQFAGYAEVMVLARELRVEQLVQINHQIQQQQIKAPSGNLVRTEIFIHGALCISLSGQCFTSLHQTNHSANRGDCLQACRRSYRVIDEVSGQELLIDNRFIMSPKDLCTLGELSQLVKTGASLFKIEGRGRSADYVFKVTNAYRVALDAICAGQYTPELAEQLIKQSQTVFNRGFWHGGYYLGDPSESWSQAFGSKSRIEKRFVGSVMNYYHKPGIVYAEVQCDKIKPGDRIAIMGPTTGYVEGDITSLYVNDHPATEAQKEDHITFPFNRVRRNDKIYLLCSRQNWQS